MRGREVGKDEGEEEKRKKEKGKIRRERKEQRIGEIR
jgi:hypothetical protein